MDFYHSGEIVDEAPRASGISHSRSVYAIYMVGDTMWPRYDEGDLLYVDPGRPPALGDFVVLELTPEAGSHLRPGYIKRLIGRNDVSITCEQYQPQGKIDIPLDQIVSIHRVIPLKELLAA